jgi:hypothetical protein
VLPKTLAARLDALFATTDFTAPERETTTPETAVLLRLAEAARQHRPAVIAYTDRGGRGLGLPFLVQEPAQLRDIIGAWTHRVTGCAAARTPQEATAAWYGT